VRLEEFKAWALQLLAGYEPKTARERELVDMLYYRTAGLQLYNATDYMIILREIALHERGVSDELRKLVTELFKKVPHVDFSQ
jgi:hypothetical protein